MSLATKKTDPDYFIPGRFSNKVLLVTGAAINSIGGCFVYLAIKNSF